MRRWFFVTAAIVAGLVTLRPAPAPAAMAAFRDLGRAPAALQVHLALTFAYRNESELDRLIAAQSDPASPLHHHYLTNPQFTAEFSPSATQYALVERVLSSAGFRVEHQFANRTVLDVVGSRASAERFFNTEIHSGVQAGHGTRYANVRAVVIPSSLRDTIIAVSGLNNLVTLQPRYVRGNKPPIWDQSIGGPLKGGSGNDGPLAYAQGYDEPVQHGYDGTGQAIANAMAGDISDSDLAAYLAYFHITPAHPLMRVPVDGGNLGRAEVETTLDIEAMSATTPGAQVYLYSFPDFTDKYAEDTYNQVVADNLVDALNSSWGGCELDGPPLGKDFALASNAIFKQGSAEGITFPVATGDYGKTSCQSPNGPLEQSTPDTDPYALAVGGTALYVDANGNFLHERGWNGSEGGISLLFKLPHYQTGVPNVDPSGRNIPDISLSGGPESAFDLYIDGRWGAVWGTSLASPLFTGLDGQIAQFKNSRLGFVNPAFYTIIKGNQYRQLMHDEFHGNNGYPATTGFDLVTGIGSPRGWALANSAL